MKLIGTNQYGNFQSTSEVDCVLLSTLNLLRRAYSYPDQKAFLAIEKMSRLWEKDPNADFLHPIRVPLTIEHITDGEFHGRLIVPSAPEILRKAGINNPERYGIDSSEINNSHIPFIYVYPNRPNTHAISVVSFDPKKGFEVIDDGFPDIRQLPNAGLAYKIERYNGKMRSLEYI